MSSFRPAVPRAALVLACALLAAATADEVSLTRPGPVVAEVRARLAGGYGWGQFIFAGIEPDVLVLWPGGVGLGVDIGLGMIASGSGGGFFGAAGLKYAVMRRVGTGPLFVKAGAGAALLIDQGFNAGVRLRLEGGLSPVAGSRVAFPVEGVLAADLCGWGGTWESLGLSVGTGLVFGRR